MRYAPGESDGPLTVREFRRAVVLVVGDSVAERRALRRLLDRWNFEVLDTAEGEAAIGLCRAREVDFVICTGMAGGLTGPALCRALRALPLARHVHVVLTTAPGDERAVAAGLEAGADDFIAAPPDAGELHARLRVGERFLAMHEDLVDKTRRLTETHDRLTALREDAGHILRAAEGLHRSMAPPRQSNCGGVAVGALRMPARQPGGILAGFAPVSPGRLSAWIVQVPGHGLAPALIAARIACVLSPCRPEEGPATRRLPNGAFVPRDPAEIAVGLHRALHEETGNRRPVSMVLADIDTGTGLVRLVQAGHPPPAIIRAGGHVEFHDENGPPIGAHADAVWETAAARLDPGDRLVLVSPAIALARGGGGDSFLASAFGPLLARTRRLPEADQLDEVIAGLARFGDERVPDDIAALSLTMP